MTELIAARVDGLPATSLPLSDGGLAYGDGLFETLLFRDGRAALVEFHLARLRLGLARLGLPAVDEAALLADSAALVAGRDLAVLKWIVTRGEGGRGYARPATIRLRRVVLLHAVTALPAAAYEDGVAVIDCAVGYATPSSVAGLKHLNRLEQVIARAGIAEANVYDGLMFDSSRRLVSATSANVFVRFGARIATPGVDRCGVAGVCRAALLDSPGFGPVEVRDIHRDELERADEMILTNAVRGAIPVRSHGDRQLVRAELHRAATAALAACGLIPAVAG
jgi:4-amino-4-deoxychorismate lyase